MPFAYWTIACARWARLLLRRDEHESADVRLTSRTQRPLRQCDVRRAQPFARRSTCRRGRMYDDVGATHDLLEPIAREVRTHDATHLVAAGDECVNEM